MCTNTSEAVDQKSSVNRMRRNFSLVSCYSLKFTCCLFLVVKLLVLVADLLVTCCRSSLLHKFTHYLLQKLLVTKNHSLLVWKFARYSLQKLLVTKFDSFLVAEVACCKNYLLLFAKF